MHKRFQKACQIVLVSEFDFNLPPELIATHPLERRDASRMLVVGDAGAHGNTPDQRARFHAPLRDCHITDFISFLKPGDVVVFNNSKVIPARFDATDAAGKSHEITLHTGVGAHNCAPGREYAPLQWHALCKKFDAFNIGDELNLSDGTKIVVRGKDADSGLLIEFLCGNPSLPGGLPAASIFEVLDKVGKMPLPPYMKRGEESSDRERYQTVYATAMGSMAAPTAGLHFTPEMLSAIRGAGAEIVNITLHVGAGTWMPVKSDDTSGHKMHSEWGVITAEQSDIINNAARVIAVGTTSLRLLESAAVKPSPAPAAPPLQRRGIIPFCGTTDIFITPGFEFKVVDVLLTNFHLPKSTLFMLVSAFAGLPEMKAAYAHAILQKYRFFSYGDCCLLFRK